MSDMPRGRFVWYDLMTTDRQSAISFYSQLIGWGTAPWEAGPESYTLWTNREAQIGGVMDLPEDAKAAGAPPHWLAYVGVPDTEETAKKTEELGGQVLHGPVSIPKVGSFAVLADPQGAAFAVFTTEEATPAKEGLPQEGEFSWHELATTNHEAAFDFYNKLFGWEKTDASDMGEMGTYQMFGVGGMPLGGMFNKPTEMPGPSFWLFYARVEDVQAAAEKVKQLGGQVLNGPMEVPGGDWIAQCLDPQGAAFAIHSSKHG
jgi:predicted enzyme related to lactoylglutathione lyase